LQALDNVEILTEFFLQQFHFWSIFNAQSVMK
jgi:hypothetical protein